MLDKLERWFGRLALPNVTLYLIIGQVGVTLGALLGRLDLNDFVLVPAAVTHGQPWRLLTFLFLPPPVNFGSMLSLVFLPFAWWIFFLMGSALEQYWGAFRYNLFLLVGVGLTVAAAFLTPSVPITNFYILMSVTLAFAWLNPDFELSLFFLLPIKIKWLAVFVWAAYAFKLVTGTTSTRFQILAAGANFLLFFGRDIVMTMRYRRRRMEREVKRFSESSQEPEPRHRCFVCGKTDLTNPEMDFRYCSKCAGDQCYCPEHIFNHEHVLSDDAGKK
jgi:hypothetical protein